MKTPCLCDCGDLAKEGNNYIFGHWTRVHNPMDDPKAREKVSKSLSGRTLSAKHIESLKKSHADFSGKKNPMFGKVSAMKGKHHTKAFKKIMSKRMSGENHPMFGKSNKWGSHTEKSKEKISIVKTGGHHTEETKELMSKAQTPEMRVASAKRCIERLKQGYKPSLFEKELIGLFQKYNFPYRFVGDGQLLIGNKCPDFVNTNGKKIVIEAYDDYWKIKHYGSVENYIKERRAHFEKHGYECRFIHYNDSKEKILEKVGR